MDQEKHQIMRSWRIILYFECLNDFNLGTIVKNNLNRDDRTPKEHYQMPSHFYMHVSVFQQKFTVEIKPPHVHKIHKSEGFSDALRHLDHAFKFEQRGHAKRKLTNNEPPAQHREQKFVSID